MHHRKLFLLTILATALLSVARPASAGVAINIGVPPACPYGYFDYAPYSCAPYGYYGPEWFTGGVFIGAGPWFHGPHRKPEFFIDRAPDDRPQAPPQKDGGGRLPVSPEPSRQNCLKFVLR